MSHQIIEDDGSLTDNYIESRRVILTKFFYSNVINATLSRYIDGQDIYNNDINPIEIDWVIKNLKINKAPSYDEMTAEIAKYIVYGMNSDLFYDIINCIWSNSVFLNSWKIIKVCLIPKEGKDPKVWDSYRPIALVPIWSKIIEQIVTKRRMLDLENNNIMNEAQHGFRSNRSTFTALSTVKYITDKIVCMITIDIKNSFGSIHKGDLMELLINYRVPYKIINFTDSYLSNRKVIVMEDDYVENNIGVPQGSSLGPILWLVIINDLCNTVFVIMRLEH